MSYATSPDTRHWTIRKEPIFTNLGVGAADPGPIPAAALQLDDGSWQLYGWAADAARSNYFASWRAGAPGLDGPWTLDRDRILVPGPPGTWDSQTAAVASVQRTATGYAAWYEGQPPGRNVRGDLGYATSSDGLGWHKFDDPSTTSAELAESDPVIRRGICGSGTDQAVFQPQVEVAPGGYLAVFGGFAPSREQMELFGAVSPDGVRWSCGTPEALLRADGIPNSHGIHSLASFPLGDGRVGLIIESLGEGHSDLWLATVRALD